MAITFSVVHASPNSMMLRVTHDATAGDTLTLTNAQLTDDLPPGPLRSLLRQSGFLAQDDPRQVLLQDKPQWSLSGNPTYVSPAGDVANGMSIDIVPRTGGTGTWGVDVDVDGDGRATLILSYGVNGEVSFANIRLEYRHSLIR